MESQPGNDHHDHRSESAERCHAHSMLGGAKGHDDEGHLKALEEHTLEGHGETRPIDAVSPTRRVTKRSDLIGKNLRFVMLGFVSARPENGFSKPLQAEHQQERTDRQAEHRQRQL